MRRGYKRISPGSLLLPFLVLFLPGMILSSPGHVTSTLFSQQSEFAQLEEIAVLGTGREGEPDLFAQPVGVALVGERILVLDSKINGQSWLRVYNLDGRYERTIGRQGEGPGEYRLAWTLAVGPLDNKIFLREAGGGRIHVYDPTGMYEKTIRLQVGGLLAIQELMLRADRRGYLHFLKYEFQPGPNLSSEVTRIPVIYLVTPEGAIEDTLRVPVPDEDPHLVHAHGRYPAGIMYSRVPFAPAFHWSITADGALCYGNSDEYAIHVERPSSTPLTIRRSVDPVRISRAEREWNKLEVTLSLRNNRDDWVWDGPRIPSTKPFFEAIFPDESGRIWVLREGPGVELKDCDRTPTTHRELSDQPCWKKTWFLDVFEESRGRFLGTVPAPERFRTFPIPYIRDDLFICGIEDNLGAPLVKVFRIHQNSRLGIQRN